MFDGVETHGFLHKLRMEDVFWARQRILLRVLDVVLAALPPPASQSRGELLSKSWRELVEAMYPSNAAVREEREKMLQGILGLQDPITIVPKE
jgi:hypothetical protein